MARRRIIAGNWKMNMTPSQAVELCATLKDLVNNDAVDVVYCVPAIDIVPVAEAIKGTNVKLGAENFYIEDKGAFTGEISAPMLKEAGVQYIIIGHSERRDIFGENDILINQKVKKAFASGLSPILCCGESLALRKAGTYCEWIKRQIKWDLEGVTADQVKELVIAYEPIWAIGTGETATADQAQEVCKMIRETIAEMYDEATAEAVRIQYGGSMNAGNAAELLSKEDIDGGLIGGAALKPDFGQIVNA
ncbi:MAG: triose-phosphate isomerase, partial [Lachnospiraceae bacterium]|nr:triose-phosphate isomerase [Lachnospiraceae bacterium]